MKAKDLKVGEYIIIYGPVWCREWLLVGKGQFIVCKVLKTKGKTVTCCLTQAEDIVLEIDDDKYKIQSAKGS